MAININHVLLSGTVSEDPQVIGEDDSAWAFFKLHTNYAQRMPDGSYADIDQFCQIVADVPHHVKTIRNYIKKGKALCVYAYYRTWQANGQTHHGFFIRSLSMAKANWGSEGGNAPPFPS